MNRTTLTSLWELVIVAATTVAGIVIPLEMVLSLHANAGSYFFETALTAVFVADVIVHGRGVRASDQSAPHYRPGLPWLVADLVAAFPFGLLWPAGRLLRLVKFFRLIDFARMHWRRHEYQSLFVRILLFGFWLAIATHWLVCGWLALRGANPDTDGWTNYLSSLYFCITTLTTVGFGDVTPANNAERMFVIGMMIFGVAVYGFAIGSVASLLTKINPARTHFRENMERLDAFMQYKSLPKHLRKRLTEYYTYLWEQRLGYDEASILASLPPSLKMEVSLHLKREIIEKVPLFNDAGDDFIKEIALEIKPVVYLPGDFVVQAGERGDDMFFVSRGELEVLSKDGQTVLARLKDGDFFGEIALILRQSRSASVRALTYCDLYRLDRDLFDRVLARYPEVAAKIEARAKERHARA